VRDLAGRRDEILANYEPIGSNGYRHKKFTPEATDLFDPERLLGQYLAKSA
jgi:hypothetical protein